MTRRIVPSKGADKVPWGAEKACQMFLTGLLPGNMTQYRRTRRKCPASNEKAGRAHTGNRDKRHRAFGDGDLARAHVGKHERAERLLLLFLGDAINEHHRCDHAYRHAQARAQKVFGYLVVGRIELAAREPRAGGGVAEYQAAERARRL